MSGTKPLSGNAVAAACTRPIALAARKELHDARGIATPSSTSGMLTKTAGKNNGGPASCSGRTSTTPNPNVRACEACFTLHKTEALLARADRRLAAVTGAHSLPGSNASRRQFEMGVEGVAGGEGEGREEALGASEQQWGDHRMLGRRGSTGSLREVEKSGGASGKKEVRGDFPRVVAMLPCHPSWEIVEKSQHFKISRRAQ